MKLETHHECEENILVFPFPSEEQKYSPRMGWLFSEKDLLQILCSNNNVWYLYTLLEMNLDNGSIGKPQTSHDICLEGEYTWFKCGFAKSQNKWHSPDESSIISSFTK